MAETNGLSWNFNPIEYAKPTELRGGYGQGTATLDPSLFGTSATAGVNNFSSIGNWSSIGMGDMFQGVASLCSFADSFTQQNASIIAQAEAYNNQTLSQGIYQAQQTAALRDQLMAQGIDPNSVLGTGATTAANSSNNQLSQILSLLGLGSTTGKTTGTTSTNSSNNQLLQLLSLFGLGSTTSSYADTSTATYDDEDGGDEAFWNYIDSKVAQSKQNSTQNSLQKLLAQLVA